MVLGNANYAVIIYNVKVGHVSNTKDTTKERNNSHQKLRCALALRGNVTSNRYAVGYHKIAGGVAE